jgi:hypothetical protein
LVIGWLPLLPLVVFSPRILRNLPRYQIEKEKETFFQGRLNRLLQVVQVAAQAFIEVVRKHISQDFRLHIIF